MVAFASLIGAAAIYAGVASAGPMMDYGMMTSSSSSGYNSAATPPPANGYGSGNSDNSPYGKMSGYGSGNSNNSPGEMMSSPPWSMSTSTSTSAAYAAATSSSSSYGSGSKYGSGSSWNNNGGYDSCVQQCVAQYGSPSSMYMPPSSTSGSSSPAKDGSPTGTGTGATHTIVVAPTQGVLRFVPFATNASVGDTLMFIWGANNHTVTKSSQLNICNKTSDTPFASGTQNKPFTFTQVVNDTNPVFFYCGTPTHCEKGMFGIINPPNAYQQPSSASNMMSPLASQNPSTQAALTYSSNVTMNNTVASNWGSSMDMNAVPGWAQSYMMENIMYTRNMIAMNPEVVSPNGNIDLSLLSNNPMMIPTDVAAAARQNNAESSTPSSSATSSTASPTPSSGAASGGLKSGASALASPRVAVALVAVAAAFFAL